MLTTVRLLWATLRSGNSGSANGCVEFLKQALTVLPGGIGSDWCGSPLQSVLYLSIEGPKTKYRKRLLLP